MVRLVDGAKETRQDGARSVVVAAVALVAGFDGSRAVGMCGSSPFRYRWIIGRYC